MRRRLTKYYLADLRDNYKLSVIITLLTLLRLAPLKSVIGPQDTSAAMPRPKLLDQVRNVARMRHLSLSTERSYAGWIRRYILFHNKKHPKEMAEKEIRQFISDLAVNAKISASTQTVALSANLFSVTYQRDQF